MMVADTALTPALAASLVGRYESDNDYTAGYSRAAGDITRYPARPGYAGFPDWPGEQGPEGKTHAAGRYQFEPDTWKRYAEPLGITDFSPESQDRVFAAAYANEGMRPWAPYNPRLRQALASKGYGSGLVGQAPRESQPLGIAPAEAMDFSAMRNWTPGPWQETPGLVATPPVLPRDSLPAGYGAGNMIAILGALGAFGSPATHKFQPIDYDPWAVQHGYTMRIGSQA